MFVVYHKICDLDRCSVRFYLSHKPHNSNTYQKSYCIEYQIKRTELPCWQKDFQSFIGKGNHNANYRGMPPFFPPSSYSKAEEEV